MDLTADDIELRLSSVGEKSQYGFECPVCDDFVWKPADDRIVQLLISGGVKASMVPDDTHSDLPALTYDDLLDFHFALENGSFLEELLNLK